MKRIYTPPSDNTQGRRRRSYCTTNLQAERARQETEERLALVRSGEFERRRLLSEAHALQTRIVSLGYKIARYSTHGQPIIEFGDMVIPEEAEMLRQWIVAAKIFEEDAKARLEEEERADIEANRSSLLERREYAEIYPAWGLEVLADFRLTGTCNVSVWSLCSIIDWSRNALQQDDLNLLNEILEIAQRQEYHEQRRQELIEESADYFDWYYLECSPTERSLHTFCSGYRVQKCHRKGSDPDRRRDWRREVHALAG